MDDLILSNLAEIVNKCPNTYAAYVAQVTIEAIKRNQAVQ